MRPVPRPRAHALSPAREQVAGLLKAALGHARRRYDAASGDRGMTTAEYAVGTVAACAFGGILYKVVTSPDVIALLTGVVKRALSLPM